MILPTKRLSPDRALLFIGGEIATLLDEPKTVSRVWEELRRKHAYLLKPVPYDWFILALDLLYALGAVELNRGKIRKARA